MKLCLPLNTGQNCGNIVGRTPTILKNIETQLSRCVYIWVEHLADELDLRRLIGVLLFELHYEAERAIFEWCVGGANNDGVPEGLVSLVAIEAVSSTILTRS